ncbi:receptor-transporting protein 3-like [Salarias fasciatus]|nr:receptor-transporting protein 3-like [Salarias fasciatus]
MAESDLIGTWTRIFQNEARGIRRGHSWHLEFDYSIDTECLYDWKDYIRNTSARFRCTECGRSWPSNQVKVIFHMRLSGTTGTVKIRPYRQNCKICSDAPMVNPNIEENNIKILMENLVKKIRIKCYHEKIGQKRRYFERYDVESPHEPSHCEGCIRGICNK